MKFKGLAVLNAIALGIHIGVSYLSQVRLFAKSTIGEVSDKYPSLFTPAGVTFSIWGLIYLSLIAFVVYHLRMATTKDLDHPANVDLLKIGSLFIVNNLAAVCWVVLWTNELITVSVVFMLIQLVSLMAVHTRLRIHDAKRERASRFFTQYPLSIYFGWISIATIANVSSWLDSISWNGWAVSEINWTLTMIAIAMLLTVWVINKRKNVFFGLVVMWAVVGIYLRYADSAPYEQIAFLCKIAVGIILAACIFGLVRNLRKR
jgi:hypothetical protein